jgi:hypothetical protein
VKTQIIQLEVHDDTISVRDKMDWSQTPRVLLVWPERGKVLRNRLDLILLERYCSSHGSQLALLTQDAEVAFHASEAGIPVFQSRRTAQLQPWRKSFREFKRQDLEVKAIEVRDRDLSERENREAQKELPPWTRISIFITAVLAVLAIAGMLLPSAEISIEEEIHQNKLVIPIRAVLGENQILLSGQVPAHELIIEAEDLQSIPTSGTTAIPSEYAEGEVRITNLGDEAITIPQNTILSTDSDNPVQFLTAETGNLPPDSGESITIKITAIDPGDSGNVLADQITTISTSLHAEVAVTNPQPTSGGTEIYVSAPNSSDRRRLDRNLSFSLKEIASREVSTLLNEDDILLTPEFEVYEVIDEVFDPDEGSPGVELHLEKRVSYSILYTSGEDLLSLATDLVNAQYQEGDYEPFLESITLSQLSKPDPEIPQTYSWEIEVSWSDHKIRDHNQILQMVLGKKPTDAVNRLQEDLNLESSPQIKLTPSWWFRIPALPFRISIIEGGS